MIGSPALFAQWLKQYPDTACVGRSHDPECCPLARFLKGIYSQRFFVGSNLIANEDQSVTAPEWVNEFVDTIDDAVPPYQEITAGVALHVLERKRLLVDTSQHDGTISPMASHPGA